MTYQYLQRHSVLRIALCFFVACLCCFGLFAPPIVTAHALIATSTIIMVTGSLLAAIGITFAAVDALNRGSSTFYNWCSSKATDVSRFIQDQAAKINLGSKAAMTIPVVIFLQLKMQAAMCFSKTQTSAPDTSGAIQWYSDSGKKISEFLPGSDRNRSYYPPIAFIMNSLPTNSPNAVSPLFSIPSSALPIQRASDPDFAKYSNHFFFGQNDVLRFVSPDGLTYDYAFYFAQTATHFILEATENGRICFTKKWALPSDFLSLYSTNFTVDFRNSISFSAAFSFLFQCEYLDKNNVSQALDGNFFRWQYIYYDSVRLKDDFTFQGAVDGRYGVVNTPSVPYAPDLAIVGNPAWDDALAKERERNPDFVGPDISIPASETDLINAHWEDMLANQAELTDALRDAIAALEEAGTGTGEGTIAGTVEVAIGDVTMPNLSAPAGIVSLFPFCIPFDIARGIEALQAPPIEPHFEIPLKYGDIMDETIVLDLSWLDFIIRFIRWAELFLWSLGLAVVTRDYIKW